jgi:hypothetical protein
MRNMILSRRNQERKNQKFVLLKVASDKRFSQHFPKHNGGFHPLSNGAIVCFEVSPSFASA